MDNTKISIKDYKDALEFTKDILSNSSSIEEIIANFNIKEDTEEKLNKES